MSNKNFPINLIGNLVAVKLDENKGPILLPDWKRNLSGIVLAVGPECKDVYLGLQVLFGAAVGMDSTINNIPIRILKEQDIDSYFEQ